MPPTLSSFNGSDERRPSSSMLELLNADGHDAQQTLSPYLPAEIPDSQPHFIDFSLEDKEIHTGPDEPLDVALGHFGREIPDSQEDQSLNLEYDVSDEPQDVALGHSGREIPDSQEDQTLNLEYDVSDEPPSGPSSDTEQTPEEGSLTCQEHQAEPDVENSSFKTTYTEIIPGGTVLTPKIKHRLPLHKKGFNVNGCVPSDNPRSCEDEMEEQPTQQATQPFQDPRREGTKPMLSGQDETDVLCILLPSSELACEAINYIAESAPQHILQNHDEDYVSEDATTGASSNLRPDRLLLSSHEDSELEDAPQDNGELVAGHGPRDIALRMSSVVHKPYMGFIFGRNPKKCDLVLSKSQKFSNAHFRIYINSKGILMLEDTSQNGTYVDNILLVSERAKKEGNSRQATRTLSHGSIIRLPTHTEKGENPIRFIVSLPARDQYLQKYEDKLRAYIHFVQQEDRKAKVASAAGIKEPGEVPMPFNPLHHEPPDTTPNGSILTAGTGHFNHGLNWNGGEKYNVVQFIGKGAFAMVFKLSAKTDGEVYAVKQIEKRKFIKDPGTRKNMHNELLVMKRLHHPHIVEYVDSHETRQHIFIIMEFVPCGDMARYTKANTAITEYNGQVMAGQIGGALKYLHRKGITHRDIKPDNILIVSEVPVIYKLSDFGLSKVVTSDETLLQTFCGTLLYCAPEIYPDYQKFKAGQKRPRGQPAGKPQPYAPTVDTWALGAVLFHLLCGRPAWTGTIDNSGMSMLESIMTIPADLDRLTQVGVTKSGIDFVRRILVIEPSMRASEDEQLTHQWVTGQVYLADQPGKEDHDEELPDADEEELDASQLNLTDKGKQAEGGLDESDFEENLRVLKRPTQGWVPRPAIDSKGNLRSDLAFNTDEPPPFVMGLQLPERSGAPPAQRLFGEIGGSALASSGVLNQDAHNALEMSMEGSYDEGSFDLYGTSFDGPEDPPLHADGGRNVGENYVDAPPATDTTHPHLHFPQPPNCPAPTASAPSLLGAEAHFGQLNMASPESHASAPSVERITPKTPKSREVSPTLTRSKRSGQNVQEGQIFQEKLESSPKRPKAIHQDAAAPGHRPTTRSSTQQRSPIIQSRSGARVNEASISQASKFQSNLNEKTQFKSNDTLPGSDDGYDYDGQQIREGGRSNTSLLPTALNSQEPDEPTASDADPGAKIASLQPSFSNTIPATTATGPANEAITTLHTETPSAPTVLPFGQLVPTAGSLPTVPQIIISKRATTFGRLPESDFVHPTKLDYRIPKCAIDIAMWYPFIEKDLEAGKKHWHKNPGLAAIISTRASLYIKVNGIHLTRGRDCWNYGKLYTGDIISVLEPQAEQKSKKDREYLRFKCEFFVGASKGERPEGEPFIVKDDNKSKFQAAARRSRDASMAKSEASHDNNKDAQASGNHDDPPAETAANTATPADTSKTTSDNKPATTTTSTTGAH